MRNIARDRFGHLGSEARRLCIQSTFPQIHWETDLNRAVHGRGRKSRTRSPGEHIGLVNLAWYANINKSVDL
jgi:hypothetical protein